MILRRSDWDVGRIISGRLVVILGLWEGAAVGSSRGRRGEKGRG